MLPIPVLIALLAFVAAVLYLVATSRVLTAELTEQRGIDIKLYVETAVGVYTLVGGLRNVSMSISGESIDASHAGTGGWRKKLAGMREWEASADTVLLMDLAAGGYGAAFAALKTKMQGADVVGGNVIGVQIEWPDGSTDTGKAILTELSMEGPYDDVAEGSITLEGSGPLVYEEAE